LKGAIRLRGREWIWGKVRILIVLLGCIAWLIGLPVLSEGKETGKLRKSVMGVLMARLGVGEPPGLEPEPGRGTTRKTIYVLGGSQHSMKLKYGVVADIQKSGGGERILVATVAGITEYAPDLERNLTNDEWTLRQLERLGVGREDIEFINLENGFFGTLTEAKTLRTLSVERGIERLVLVCSGYHSRRVWMTFSALFEGSGVEIEIHTADEKIGTWGLLIEYGKFLFYKNVLIPFEVWSQKREKLGLSAAPQWGES
jgi:uncharacterized SAM-binding protein YcdF (DUF218 family)